MDGTLTYLVAEPPEAIPEVRPRDLALAWDGAREMAKSARFGAPRLFRFQRGDGSTVDLALTDRDARCWAHAIDLRWGVHTWPGLAVFLRLLALVDLLGRARWAAPLVRFAPDGADLDPELLHLAATQPLTRDARFDEAGLHARLAGRHKLQSGRTPPRPLSRPNGAVS